MRLKVEAPYERGEATRARILDAAIGLFGTFGFDSVSTREIAADAAVPQASLRYYFESKQRLYIACLEQVQAQIFHVMRAALEDAEAQLKNDYATTEEMISSFCALQEALVDALLGSNEGGIAALLVLRHDLPSRGGSGELSGDLTNIDRIRKCFTDITMRISGNRLNEDSASRLTGLINGQISNVHLRRHRLREEGWEITDERFLWLKSMIRKHTIVILQSHEVGA